MRVQRQILLRHRAGEKRDTRQKSLFSAAHIEGTSWILVRRLGEPRSGKNGIDVMDDRLGEDQVLIALPHTLDHALRYGIEHDLASGAHRLGKHLLEPRSLDGARQAYASLGPLATLARLEIDCHE